MMVLAVQSTGELISVISCCILAIALAVIVRVSCAQKKALTGKLHMVEDSLMQTKKQRDTDEVSGCLTRSSFIRQAQEILNEEPEEKYVIVCIDVDSFKEYNDQFGYAEGDRLLKYIGLATERFAGDGGKRLMCRMRADTFFVLGPWVPDFDEAGNRFAVFMGEYESDYRIRYHRGAYVIHDPFTNIIQCMDNAFAAMKYSKQIPGQKVLFYDEKLHFEGIRKQVLLNEAEPALFKGQYRMRIQPLVEYVSKKIVGAEAIIRWRHPQFGLIEPGELLDYLEKSGSILEIDRYSIEQVCILQRSLIDKGITPVPVSINVSPIGFVLGDQVSYVLDTLGRYHVRPDLLVLELTESETGAKSKETVEALKELRSHGVGIALDKFGQGSISTNILVSFPFDYVKINVVHTDVREEKHKSNLVTSSAIRMIRWLGILPIVNEIEHDADALDVYNFGSHIMQGNLFHKPIDPGEYEKLLLHEGTAEVIGKKEYLQRPVTSYETAIVGDVFDIVMGQKDVVAATNVVLKMMGEHFRVDRVYIFEDSLDHRMATNTFEWCKNKKNSRKADLRKCDYKKLYDGHIMRFFDERGVWCVKDTKNLPDIPIKKWLRIHRIKSFIEVAMYENGEYFGCIGFDSNDIGRDWDEGQIETLRMVARIISAGIAGARLVRGEKTIVDLQETLQKLNEANEEISYITNQMVSAKTGLWVVQIEENRHSRMLADLGMRILIGASEDDSPETCFDLWWNGIAESDRELVLTGINNMRTSGQAEVIYPWHYPDGREIYVRCAGSPNPNYNGPGYSLGGFHQDITGIVMTQEKQDGIISELRSDVENARKELEAAYKEATRANAAKTNFLSAMSHDIRTPLNAVVGMIDIALHNLGDPKKVEDCLKKIKRSGAQLISLVNDILDISAVESGKLKLRLQPYHLKTELDNIRLLFEQQCETKGLTCRLRVHDLESPCVLADGVRLNQIIINLIGNSVKYTPEGGSISGEVYQERDENGVLMTRFVLEDTGIGMSKEFMNQMFEPFARETGTSDRNIQGTGLGLPIVANLVKLMNGKIEAESELHVGTTFRICIPLERCEQEENTVGESSMKRSGKTDVKVLCAEDNDLNWEIISELLEINGIWSERAVNGEECVRMFTGADPRTYDIIFMDMQMPVMDGLAATRAIRASEHPEAKTIPIVAMTANAYTEDIANCKEAGMNDHLSKPVEIPKVLAAIDKYVKK